jgi:AMMECR1 domain-containing protein
MRSSAFGDSRFDPIAFEELPNLQCSVSLLGNFVEAADPLDWHVGRHGIQIAFNSSGKRLSATYLPEVAVDQGYSKDQCIQALMRKAGHRAPDFDGEVMRSMHVTRYESTKTTLSYIEHCERRSNKQKDINLFII